MPQSFRALRRRRRDWGRLWAQLLCVVFGLVGAVPFGLGLLARTTFVRAWAARETARVLEREIGIVARCRVEVQAWPLRVGLSDLVVPSLDDGPPALEVGRVSVRPRIFSLLAGRLDAGNIEVDSPRARAVVEQGKLVNVSYRLP